ncbi:alpha-mannosidase 2-like [Oppia nitens]|uniref:alpha-mannosidase 2-like n=1 Tax=Oppia nitens TaxID=1686743 RepID=UPI0023DACD69|nr:alpha-mannosidase 2-like [Oppia nitens]
MPRLMAKKGRLRLFLCFLVPIIVLIFLIIYTTNDLKINDFVPNYYRLDDNNDNRLNGKDSDSVINDINNNDDDNHNSDTNDHNFDNERHYDKNIVTFAKPITHEEDLLSNDIHNGKCLPFASNLSVDINTIDGYKDLEFNPKFKSYWNYTFERKYEQTRDNWHELPLKVIILPHSHNDPGWLKTFEQYYYDYTALILNNMVDKLTRYHNMTFIWAEMSFMSRWWESLKNRPQMRESVKYLIKSGQLEIVTGGWVMTDEGPAHYWDMIDQLIEGHQFLRTSIGLTESPINGWSIDPFGHGMTFPYILKKSGINNTLIERTHFGWKTHFAAKQQLEFIWKQVFDTSSSWDLFCQMSAFDLYSIKFTCGPNTDICLQFDFRRIAGESSESTSVKITEDNVEERANLMVSQYGRLASLFPHNIALVPLGDDFRFNYDTEWDQQYDNYNKLMQYIRSNPLLYNKTEIKFGTLNDYFQEVHQRMEKMNENKFPTLYGDFMPYADVYVDGKPHYWSGYYTTRPYWKSLSRQLQHLLRSAEILYSLTRNQIRQSGSNQQMLDRLDKDYEYLSTVRQNLALFQHHDAITGTSKEHVMEDYGKKLNIAISLVLGVISHSVQFILAKDNTVLPTDMNAAHPMTAYLFPDIERTSWDQLSQKSVLFVPPVDGRKLVVFNSHLQTRIEVIRVYVRTPSVRVIDGQNGNEIQSQINPIFNSTAGIATNGYELQFIVSLSPLSLTTFVIQTFERRHRSHHLPKVSLFLSDADEDEDLHKSDGNVIHPKVFKFDTPMDNKEFELETPYIKVRFDRRTGFITHIIDKKSNFVQKVHLSLRAYKSAEYNSGAYLFKPSQFDPIHNITERFPIMRLIRGDVSSELTVIYPNFIEVNFKVYNTYSSIASAVQMYCKFDLSKREDLMDWELIMRVETDINTIDSRDGRKRFYVDSNGFQMIERKYVDSLGIDGNYYPMTSSMYIEDNNSRLTLLASHSHGVSSPLNGTIEVMLERKLRFDDNRGVGEGVADNKLTISRFWIAIERTDTDYGSDNQPIVPNLSQLMYSLLSTLLYEPIVLASDGQHNRPTHSTMKFLSESFDCNLFLVNLRTLPEADNFELPSQSSLLLLHNRGNTCRIRQQITPKSMLCLNSKNRPKSFANLRIQSINECSLTAFKTLKPVTDLSTIDIPEMQINAYDIKFVK